jgi:hypothetical protein
VPILRKYPSSYTWQYDNGGSKQLRNVGKLLTDYTVQHPIMHISLSASKSETVSHLKQTLHFMTKEYGMEHRQTLQRVSNRRSSND